MTFALEPATAARRATIALATLSVAAFCFVTTEVLPIGLLTLMADDLRRPESAVGLLVTGYAAVVLIASVPLVWLTQRAPRRQLLAGTLAVFAVAALVSGTATGYGVLLVARLTTALAQALFWSVVASTAAGLFPPAVRGRVIARLAIGSALAPVLGVPAGVWLGQTFSWRVPFVVMAAAGAGTAVAVLLTVPSSRPGHGSTSRGATPHRRRYLGVLAVTALAVTGAMGTFTYITPFLLDVSGFAPSALGLLLLVAGLAGIGGTWSIGTMLDRRPRLALVVPLATLTVALTGLAALGTVKGLAVVALAALGLGFNALAPAIQSRTLEVAPGSTDLASAGSSAVFNAGIAAGSFLGGMVLTGPGVHAVPLLAVAPVAAALAIAAGELRRAPDHRAALSPRRRTPGITAQPCVCAQAGPPVP